MKNIVKKSLLKIFLAWFLINSLVFLGQDISLKKNENGTWLVTLAEHHTGKTELGSVHLPVLDGDDSSHPHGHHKRNVHLCVELHKFTAACKNPGAIPGADSNGYFSLVPERIATTGLNSSFPGIILKNHGPGIGAFKPRLSPTLLL